MVTVAAEVAAFIGRRRLRKQHQREQAAIDAFVLETCEAAVRTSKQVTR